MKAKFTIFLILTALLVVSCQKDKPPFLSSEYGTKSLSVDVLHTASDTETAINTPDAVYESDIQKLTATYKLAGNPEATYVYPKETDLAHGVMEITVTLKNGETVNLKEYASYNPEHLLFSDDSDNDLLYEDFGKDAFAVFADADTWGGTATLTITYEGLNTSIANIRYAPGLRSIKFSVNDCNKSTTASFLRTGYNFRPQDTDMFGITPYVELDIENLYRGAEFSISATNTAGNEKVIETAWCFMNGGRLFFRNRTVWAYLWKNYFDYGEVYCIQGNAEDYM